MQWCSQCLQTQDDHEPWCLLPLLRFPLPLLFAESETGTESRREWNRDRETERMRDSEKGSERERKGARECALVREEERERVCAGVCREREIMSKNRRTRMPVDSRACVRDLKRVALVRLWKQIWFLLQPGLKTQTSARISLSRTRALSLFYIQGAQ